MPSSTPYDVGAVVLVRIRFSDGTASKKRPAVIVSVPAYHASRADAVIVALTTQMRSNYFGDYDLVDWATAGLPLPSRAKGVIQTIERQAIERKFGKLSVRDLERVQDSVRQILGL